MAKTVKDKIITRLNKGFGFEIPCDARWHTHERAFRDAGGMSWYFCDNRLSHRENCGASVSATEVLQWKKWVIDEDAEIFEYFEYERNYYINNGCWIEGEKQKVNI